MTHAVKKGVLLTLWVLAAGTAMALAVVWGHQADPAFTQFLNSPSPWERSSQQARPNLSDDAKEAQVPLIKAAKAFSLYLNPPAKSNPPAPASSPTTGTPTSETKVAAATTPEVRPAVSSPQFQLQGISYHRSKPETSMALVWQSDTGRRWVRQGTELGHLIIEQINSEGIVYRDGQLTHELALKLDATLTVVAQQGTGKTAPAKPGERSPSASPATPPRIVESSAVKVAEGASGTPVTGRTAGSRPVVAKPASSPKTPSASSKSVTHAVAAERRRWAKIPYQENVTGQEKRSR